MNLSSYIKKMVLVDDKKCRMFYSFGLSLINLTEIFSQNKVSLYTHNPRLFS